MLNQNLTLGHLLVLSQVVTLSCWLYMRAGPLLNTDITPRPLSGKLVLPDEASSCRLELL